MIRLPFSWRKPAEFVGYSASLHAQGDTPLEGQSNGAVARKRRRSLAARLSTFAALIVGVALVLMGLTSSIIMQSWMTDQADDALEEQLARVAKVVDAGDLSSVLHGLNEEAAASQETLREIEQGDRQSLENGGDRKGPRRPPGLDGPGSSEGSLQLVRSGDQYVGGLIHHFEVVELDVSTIRILSEVPVRRHPVTVTVGDYGDFRVLAGQTPKGTHVLVGQSTHQIESLSSTLFWVQVGIAVLVVIVAVFASRGWIVREMRPLTMVASTARNLSNRELSSGNDIEPFERVDGSAVQDGTEVGDVGRALNAMIDNAEGALTARAESEQRLRQFVADASHELRTPLAAIAGYTQLMQRDSIESQVALERIASESKRMSALVEDLLLLARLDAGRELQVEEVDVLPLIMDAAMDAHAAGSQHKWDLQLPGGEGNLDGEGEGPSGDYDVAETALLVNVDESALRQVITNLVTNARIHTPVGTTVTLGVRRVEPQTSDHSVGSQGEVQWRAGTGPQGSVVITVADNGQGIAPELRATIFDRFVRGDSSRTRSTGQGSSGLGLSIVLSIVEAMGGRVDMTSICAGEDPRDPNRSGTRFDVYLPAK